MSYLHLWRSGRPLHGWLTAVALLAVIVLFVAVEPARGQQRPEKPNGSSTKIPAHESSLVWLSFQTSVSGRTWPQSNTCSWEFRAKPNKIRPYERPSGCRWE